MAPMTAYFAVLAMIRNFGATLLETTFTKPSDIVEPSCSAGSSLTRYTVLCSLGAPESEFGPHHWLDKGYCFLAS